MPAFSHTSCYTGCITFLGFSFLSLKNTWEKMLKGDHFWEVQRPSEVGACWSEGPLMQSTLLRTGEAILCSLLTSKPGKWASLEEVSVYPLLRQGQH